MHISGIDEIDNKIVSILLEDGRSSYSDIALEVGLSRTAVKSRIDALERSGIIKGYKAVIDPQAAPEMSTFIINVETKAECFDDCKRIFAKARETVTIVQTTGNCHLIAVCVSTDVKSMREFVNGIYKNVPGVQYISAHSVIDVIKGSILPEN